MAAAMHKETTQRMEKCIEALKHALAKLRTGRAHPSILEGIKVDYYGVPTDLTQVANVAVEDARTLTVTPWEKTMVSAVEKAIITAELGLNPSSAGVVIRVPLPPLTEERRKDLVRVVREEAENARIAIRNVRRDANNDFKKHLKEKIISEDDERRAEGEIQKLTDEYVAKIDQTVSEKEKDLMQV